MSIGQFAQAGGLTVKALRFYDERGVLVPAAVDPDTGYRRYRAAQLRDAVALQALRAADVGLDDARAVIDDEDRGEELLTRIGERREADRARQDAAFARARAMIAALRDGPEVHERDAHGRAWVGLCWRHAGGDDAEAHGAAMEAEITALSGALHAAGAGPLGSPCFTYRGDGTATGSMMLGALPVEPGADIDLAAIRAAVEARAGSLTGDLERGWLPPRREAYTRVAMADVEEAGPGATLLPALVVLGEYLEGPRADGGDELRQTTVPVDGAGEVLEIEYAGTVAR